MEDPKVINLSSMAPSVPAPASFAAPANVDIQPPVNPPLPTPQFSGGGEPDSFITRVKGWISGHKGVLAISALSLVLLINLGISAWLFHRVDKPNVLSVKTSGSSGGLVGDDTLYINTKDKSVGVAAATPEGLQVGSLVTQTARDTANVRLGLLNGQPVVLFEDGSQQQWQLGMSNSSIQIGQPGAAYFTVDKTGNTTIGNAAANTVTFQAAALATPNNLNINNNTLFVDAAHTSVAIGANNAQGNKLYVAGTIRSTGSVQSGGQIIGVTGSAAQPAITFAGNTNTGIFSAASNIVSITSAGSETLRIQPGNVSTANGASLSVGGYLQSGGSSPAWQIIRYTGHLDGAGTGVVAHGISNASARVILAMGWYESASGTARPLGIDFIDGANFQVSGGSAGAAWRGVIVYTADSAGW